MVQSLINPGNVFLQCSCVLPMKFNCTKIPAGDFVFSSGVLLGDFVVLVTLSPRFSPNTKPSPSAPVNVGVVAFCVRQV